MRTDLRIFRAVVLVAISAAGIGAAGQSDKPHPAVAVAVSAAAQLAAEDDAPVLPDDFARNDPPRVSAEWSASQKPAEAAAKPNGFKFFTTDGSFRCAPCESQKAVLSSGGSRLQFEYEEIRVPSGGRSPTGSVPCWQAPDGTVIQGSHSIDSLNAWAKRHQPIAAASPPAAAEAEAVEVTIESDSAESVLLALAAHVARHQQPNTEVARAVQSWLPEIDIDVSDGILRILDSMLKPEGMTAGGLTVMWPSGPRSIELKPAAQLRFRKFIEIDVELTKITVDGRRVMLAINRFPDLTVRLK